MAYRTNGGYRSGVSYNFSSRSSDYAPNNFNQINYKNSNPIIHYSANPGISYSSSSNFGYEREGAGSGYVTRSGGSSGRGMGGGGKGSGRGAVRSVGRGGSKGRGIRNSGQGCTNIQNQFIADREKDSQLTEIDLAINNLNLTESQNQFVTQEVSQLEIVHCKKTIFVKKGNQKEEHLERIIRKVELVSKKSNKS